jgi:hypothetical protein
VPLLVPELASCPTLLTRERSLDQPWIYQEPPPTAGDGDDPENGQGRRRVADSGRDETATQRAGDIGVASSTSSSVSLGDTHVWRDG